MSHNSKWARNYKFGFGKVYKYSKIWRYCFTLYWYKSQIVFEQSGNSNKNEYEKTGSNFIYLEPSAVDWIVNHNIKCVGIDTLSIEREDFTEGIIHKKLLSHDIGIIENLNSNL